MKYYYLAFRDFFKKNQNISENYFWAYFGINFLVIIALTILSRSLFSSDLPADIYKYISVIVTINLGMKRLQTIGLNKYLFLIPIANLYFTFDRDK